MVKNPPEFTVATKLLALPHCKVPPVLTVMDRTLTLLETVMVRELQITTESAAPGVLPADVPPQDDVDQLLVELQLPV